MPTQFLRNLTQAGFFVLFVLAPPLDIFRLDLNLGHFILFGHNWTLGLESFQQGQISSAEAIFNLILRGFVPIALVIVTGVWVSWKYGRLYCGWLCPHFSVVEMINRWMRRASGKPSIWERQPLPEEQPDGSIVKADARYWFPVGIGVIGFAFLWAISLLTYLITPSEVYSNLLNASLTRFQGIFLFVTTLVLSIEFLFARHLFCRFGCAIGLFQSLAWMGNHQGMVVGFERARSDVCRSCQNQCDNACPMRLRPRLAKRRMFTCTQCSQCIDACNEVNTGMSLLRWVSGKEAEVVAERRSSDTDA